MLCNRSYKMGFIFFQNLKKLTFSIYIKSHLGGDELFRFSIYIKSI